MDITLCVANRFIRQARTEDVLLSPLKLQCLIYLLYRQYLKKTKRRLFDEVFVAALNGPMLLSMQTAMYELRNCNGGQVDYFRKSDGTFEYINIVKSKELQYAFVDVWYDYKNRTGEELLKSICKPTGAWQKARNTGSKVLADIDIYKE